MNCTRKIELTCEATGSPTIKDPIRLAPWVVLDSATLRDAEAETEEQMTRFGRQGEENGARRRPHSSWHLHSGEANPHRSSRRRGDGQREPWRRGELLNGGNGAQQRTVERGRERERENEKD